MRNEANFCSRFESNFKRYEIHIFSCRTFWNHSVKYSTNYISLSVGFNITEQDGIYTTTIDSPDQGAKDFPTNSTKVTGNSIEIIADSIKMTFKGKLHESGMIKGTFKQGEGTLPLNLSKEDEGKTEVKPRPQDPQNFPYQQEDVKFKNQETGNHLTGTLTIPENGHFEKVVVLISGSGPQNRNEEITAFDHRPFLVLSDHLTKQGIAVLRYDDRGIGESEGDFDSATSKDFALKEQICKLKK